MIFRWIFVCLLIASASHASFEVKYVDRQGTRWGAIIDHTSNGCNYNDNHCRNQISDKRDSNAFEACRLAGGRLPTAQEYQNLLSNFQRKPGTKDLTELGKSQLYRALNDMRDGWYWTSTVQPGNPNSAACLDTYADRSSLIFPDRQNSAYVRCVSR